MSGRRYLSHLRLGAAAFVETPDLATSPNRFATTVEMAVNGAPVSVPVTVFGPADVTGVAADGIAARVPAPGSVGAEVNYFPHVELRPADLPWRYTPAKGGAEGRLRPWLALVVLAVRPGVEVVPGAGRLPVIEAPVAELPDPMEADLWAHVQVTVPDGPLPLPLADYVAENPDRAVARLLAPRRMAPQTPYVACLVPTFEAGRLAGLGQGNGAGTLAPAWSYNPASTARVRLPVYDHWRFSTGVAADFESLARQLAPYEFPAEAAAPEFEVDPALGVDDTQMQLRGALEPARRVPVPPPPVPQAVADALAARINRLADLANVEDAPQVGSPLYGRWPAARRRLGETDTPAWLAEANTDPRHRIAAAAGGDVVQREQEGLVAEAWRQLGEVRAANALLRGAQTARGIGARLKARHLDAMPDDMLLQVVGPTLARLPSGAGAPTLFETVARSAVPQAGFEGAFRRLSRPLGPHMRRYGTASSRFPAQTLFRQEFERQNITGWSTIDQGAVSRPSDWRTLGMTTVLQRSNIHSGLSGPGDISFFGTMFVTGSSAMRDVRFKLRIESVDNDTVGFVFRYRSSSNYYRFSMNSQIGLQRLVKCVNGRFTSLWERNQGFITNTMYQFEVLAEGDRIRIWMEREFSGRRLIVDVRDGSHASGRVGLYCCGNDNVRFSNISIDRQMGFQSALAQGSAVDQGNTAPPSRWFVEDGHIRQSSNIYRPPWDRDDLPKLGTYLRIGATSWTDYHIETRLEMPDDNDALGIMFRVRDPNNFYRFSTDRERSYQRLVKCVNGRFTSLWQRDIGYAGGGGIGLSLIADGSRIRGDIDGRKAFELRDRTHMNGQVGLYCWGAVGARFEDVKVRTLTRESVLRRLNTSQFTEFPVPPQGSLAMEQMRGDIMTALDPHRAVRARVMERLTLPAARTSKDPLEEERPALSFPRPLAPRLAGAAPELLLPGVTGVPDNAVAMLLTNPAFVAAFLLGANHEMARELLWRGIPADLKATLFHQFWDVRGSGAAAHDIDDIAGWPAARPLSGQIASQRPRAVFLIRSELIRRFPALAVYLVRAVASGDGRRPGTEAELPQFGGTLGDGMAYYGFQRAPSEVIGTDDGLGWYMVIEQRGAALRFGLDLEGPEVPATWAELAWTHFGDGETLHSASLIAAPPEASPAWARNGAHMAAITHQQPVRLYIHADRLVSGEAADA
jgi:hypothetical protein